MAAWLRQELKKADIVEASQKSVRMISQMTSSGNLKIGHNIFVVGYSKKERDARFRVARSGLPKVHQGPQREKGTGT